MQPNQKQGILAEMKKAAGMQQPTQSPSQPASPTGEMSGDKYKMALDKIMQVMEEVETMLGAQEGQEEELPEGEGEMSAGKPGY